MGERNFNVHQKSQVQIVVVDDDEDVRNCFKQAFVKENYKVHSCHGIIDTLAMLRYTDQSIQYICVIDYVLEDGNGIQLASELAQRNVNSINIIISAGLDPTMYEHQRYCEDMPENCSHVNKFLEKPISMSELLKEVEKFI